MPLLLVVVVVVVVAAVVMVVVVVKICLRWGVLFVGLFICDIMSS